MLERSPAAAESPGPPAERSLEGTGRSPPTHLLVRDSSTYSLSEAGSHSRYVCVCAFKCVRGFVYLHETTC